MLKVLDYELGVWFLLPVNEMSCYCKNLLWIKRLFVCERSRWCSNGIGLEMTRWVGSDRRTEDVVKVSTCMVGGGGMWVLKCGCCNTFKEIMPEATKT